MSKASKLARAQKNVPAVSQKVLTKANRWVNFTSAYTSSNTHTHLEGTVNSTTDAAFWLVEEATNGYTTNTTAPHAGEGMFINDLQLSYYTSYVRLTVSFNGDTSNGNTANVLKIQRSISGAGQYDLTTNSDWNDIYVADSFTGSASGAVARVSATSATGLSHTDRSIENGNIRVIDTTPGTLTPSYRVLIHIYPTPSTSSIYYSYLNRDSSQDNTGSGIGVGNGAPLIPRTISTFTAEEIINY